MPPHGEGRSKERKRNRPPRTKQCLFCKDHLSHLDYKDVPKVRKLVNDRGKMLPRRVTGHCAKHQRLVTVAIKRARHVALIPYVNE